MMTQLEMELRSLLIKYKQYAYDLDVLLQGVIDEEAKKKYQKLEEDRLLLEKELERLSEPSKG